MKTILSFLLCLLFTASHAQTATKRNIRLKNLGNDSINISLNDDYYLIEDSCAQITRYAHYNHQQKKFTGKFTDRSNANKNLVVAEGSYSPDGLKEGDFTTHYLNGNLQAKGAFKANKFDGVWNLFYDDGKPQLTFEAAGNELKITNAWNVEGKKTVSDGKGFYQVNLGNVRWEGKLMNGSPDGRWEAIRTNDRTNTAIVTEHFKNGVFKKGQNAGGEYTDSTHIILINENDLPFLHAERLRVSSIPCNGTKRKQIVNAQYRTGFPSFSEEIKEVIKPYLQTVDFRFINEELNIEGVVLKNGMIAKLDYTHTFDMKIGNGIVNELRKLPPLEPALIDGKPVEQKFVITFTFNNGFYRFNYRFLPIKEEEAAGQK